MEDKILTDTSVLINLQKAEEKTVKLFDKFKNEIIISRVTAYELIYGSKNNREKGINKKFLEMLSILEINEAISKYTYYLLDKYNLAMKLGIADALIASSSIVYGITLWTLNTRHFSKIKELKLFKP